MLERPSTACGSTPLAARPQPSERVIEPTAVRKSKPAGAPSSRRAARMRSAAWAPLPLLWRSDDYRRNLRRRAPRALASPTGSGSTPHEIAALPASLCLSPSPPLARRSRNAMSSRPPQTLSSRCAPPSLASSPPKKRVVFAPDDDTGCPPPPPPHGRSVRDPKIPIGPAQPNRVSSFPRFPPYEAFGRRPRAQSQRACKGPPSETLQ